MDEETVVMDIQEEVSEEAPTEEVITEETPAPVEEPTAPAPELYELPDGRKVDAETLSKEWKENFMPDYTKKAQELAKVTAPIIENKPTNPLEDPNYVPTTYAELAQQIKQDTLREIEERNNAASQARQALEEAVSSQLTEVKAIDPNVNENALFLHATKYGFRDLKMAHQNMRDMSETMKKVQTTTAHNIAKRNDPVSVSPGATGTTSNPADFKTANEFLRSLK